MNKYQSSLANIKSIDLDYALEKLDYEDASKVSFYGISDYPNFEMSEDISNLQELIDKQEKYKWHDLRKNPKDLPKDKEFVLCEWVGGSHNWHDVLMFKENIRPHFVNLNIYQSKYSIIGTPKFNQEGQVIAWRYIEEFEDDRTV